MIAEERLMELFDPVEGVSLKRMFGGIGVFKEGVMFGLVDDGELFLKADEVTSKRYEAEGQGRWVYEGRGKQVAMPYWRLPERLYDEPEEFREWAAAAFAVAAKAKKPKAKKPVKKIAVKKPLAKMTKEKTAPKRR